MDADLGAGGGHEGALGVEGGGQVRSAARTNAWADGGGAAAQAALLVGAPWSAPWYAARMVLLACVSALFVVPIVLFPLAGPDDG